MTGVSWLFMIVDGFFDASPFTYLATVVNGAQGVFIFISYACQKRVFQLMKELRGINSKNSYTLDGNHTTKTQL